ncbi:MAG TPA: tetratricopeptide repeat protein [Vicinamibacteria bacterium]|nr:tetratricopeptide repeat protein [Vicinamibacteria bacterium]
MMPLSVLVLAVWVQAAPPTSNQSAAYGLFLEALSLREQGQNDEALKVLQKTLKADPKAADAHAEMARIHMDEGRFSLAVQAVNQAVKVSPDRADLRSLAGQVHQFYGQSGGGEAELRLAVSEYEAASALDPADPAPLRDLTRLYSVLRNAKAALDTWKRLSIADPRNIDAFMQVANLSINAGDTKGAVEALETAAAADPQNARVLQVLGDIQREGGKTEEALKRYEAAAKLDPRDLITRLKIGEILIDSHRGTDALEIAGEMLKEDASNRFGLDLKARALKELGRVDEALEIAESLAASDPKDLKAAFLVVTLLEQKGALEQADARLSALLRRNTSNEDADSIARNNRVFWAHAGMVRQRLGRYQEAADAFGEAAKSGKEKDASLVTYRIDALISAKAFDKALAEVRAAKQEPAFKDEADLKFLEAYALRGTGDEKGASAMVEALLKATRDEANDTLAAADFYQRGKNLPRAQELFARVAEKDPKNVRALFSLGSVLERQKKYEEAEKAFRAALALAPESAITLNYLGYMNADRNVKVEEALSFIQKALADDPENGSYLDSLAWALHRLGRNGEAEIAIRKAILTQEKNAVVIAHLGLILAAKGDHAEALKYLRLSLEGEDEDGELDRTLVENKIRDLSRAAQKKP